MHHFLYTRSGFLDESRLALHEAGLDSIFSVYESFMISHADAQVLRDLDGFEGVIDPLDQAKIDCLPKFGHNVDEVGDKLVETSYYLLDTLNAFRVIKAVSANIEDKRSLYKIDQMVLKTDNSQLGGPGIMFEES
jgi:hypothetical protein